MLEGVNKVPFFTLTCKRKLAVAPNEQIFVRNDCWCSIKGQNCATLLWKESFNSDGHQFH